jgi:hypothetical protein
VIEPFCDCAHGTQGYGRGGDGVLANLTNNGMYFVGPFEECAHSSVPYASLRWLTG